MTSQARLYFNLVVIGIKDVLGWAPAGRAGARLQIPFQLDIHFFHSISYRFKLVVIERQAEMIDTPVFLPAVRLELGVV